MLYKSHKHQVGS